MPERVVHRVDDVAQAFAELVNDRSPASIALSGGELAEDCYRALAATAPDWSGVTVYMGDERFVPVQDPDSNEGMARRVLLDSVHPREIHSMAEAGPDLETAAAAYDELIRRASPIDLVHLGLGPDGHTASLFPGSSQLEVRDRYVVSGGDDLHPHPRLTFTYPAIAASRLVVFTVDNGEKRELLARVLDGDALFPAARVTAPEVVWLVESDAA
ncbi:MAG TPA: 6-phosphogluconolactonase [Acidimicrobiia bacterium]|jgi:6-phosphogluconolactonase